MTVAAAEFIEKVAASSLVDARKKWRDLQWGTMSLLTATWDPALDKDINPKACALGIAELAACNTPDIIRGFHGVSELSVSQLGKKAAREDMNQRLCPFKKGKTGTRRCNHFTLDAEDAVTHVNDIHAKSWPDCKKLLRQLAKFERTACRGN